MKKDIKNSGGKRKLFAVKNKRAYIALLVLAVLIGISVTARNRAINTIENQTSFDDEAWNAAVKESGVELPEIKDVEKKTEIKEEKNTVPVATNTAPEKEEPKPLAKEYFETVEAAALDEVIFVRPSKGSVLNDYSGDELVYSETMEDWRTHNGIDFQAEEGDQVVATAKGTVKKVYDDDLLGITVEIEHSDGVVSRYSGLQSLDFIKEGQRVESGDIIGGVGSNGALEQESRLHLHFEITKNGEYENPNLYFAK